MNRLNCTQWSCAQTSSIMQDSSSSYYSSQTQTKLLVPHIQHQSGVKYSCISVFNTGISLWASGWQFLVRVGGVFRKLNVQPTWLTLTLLEPLQIYKTLRPPHPGITLSQLYYFCSPAPPPRRVCALSALLSQFAGAVPGQSFLTEIISKLIEPAIGKKILRNCLHSSHHFTRRV